MRLETSQAGLNDTSSMLGVFTGIASRSSFVGEVSSPASCVGSAIVMLAVSEESVATCSTRETLSLGKRDDPGRSKRSPNGDVRSDKCDIEQVILPYREAYAVPCWKRTPAHQARAPHY